VHDPSLGVQKVERHKQVLDDGLEELRVDLFAFTHFANVLKGKSKWLVNKAFVQAIFSWKLKLF
jgi:hypothetical protein